MDGSLVLGGYDAAKTSGPNLTESLGAISTQCSSSMYVTITGLVLGFPNGTDFDLLQGSTKAACLAPDYPALMSLPSDITDTFETVTNTADYGLGGGPGLQWIGMLFDPANV